MGDNTCSLDMANPCLLVLRLSVGRMADVEVEDASEVWPASDEIDSRLDRLEDAQELLSDVEKEAMLTVALLLGKGKGGGRCILGA